MRMPIVVNKSERLIIVGSSFLTPTVSMDVPNEVMGKLQPFIDSGDVVVEGLNPGPLPAPDDNPVSVPIVPKAEPVVTKAEPKVPKVDLIDVKPPPTPKV